MAVQIAIVEISSLVARQPFLVESQTPSWLKFPCIRRLRRHLVMSFHSPTQPRCSAPPLRSRARDMDRRGRVISHGRVLDLGYKAPSRDRDGHRPRFEGGGNGGVSGGRRFGPRHFNHVRARGGETERRAVCLRPSFVDDEKTSISEARRILRNQPQHDCALTGTIHCFVGRDGALDPGALPSAVTDISPSTPPTTMSSTKKDKGATAPEAKECANCLAREGRHGITLKA